VWLGNRHQGNHEKKGCRVQRDRRVVTSMSRLLAERYLTELVEPCGALPRRCLFIYSFMSAGAASSPML
jgi:hypothetical protein